MRKNSLILAALFFLSLFAVLPLWQKGFFPVHDDTQIARVFEMQKGLTAGQFPVRWVPDLGYGYGYPIFNFYAPFAYYIGAIFMLLGLSALPATKLMIGVGMLLAGFGMYFFTRQFLSKTAAFIASLLYLYAPYHAVNLYVRGAIAELWAYAFVPFAFYGFHKVFVSLTESKEKKTKNKERLWIWIAVAAFSYAGIIVSHNLTALMVTPFMLVFLALLGLRLYKQNGLSAFFPLFYALIFAFLLSAFYWLPAILEMKYTNVASVTGGGSQYKDHFVCLAQLWSSPWGFGGSVPGCLDGLSFQLGKLHVLLGLVSLVAFVLARKKQTMIYWFALFGFAVSIIMLLPIAKPLWDSFSFMKFIQFPWRYLGLAAFFLSFLGGYSIWVFQTLVPKKINATLVSILVLFVVCAGIGILYLKDFKPQVIIPNYRDETNLTTLRWTISKISDEYLPPHFAKPTREADVATNRILTPSGSVFTQDRLTSVKALTDASEQTVLHIQLAAFPAWTFSVDNKQTTATIDGGTYRLVVPAGAHSIQISWQQTRVEKIADVLSLIGLLGLVLGIILQRKFAKNAKTS